MEITLDKKSSTEGLIKIKVTEGDYQPHVEEKVKDYARKANLKGFRQGKVPAGIIRKMFGKSILVDEINHLLSHKLSDYIKENNLKILGEPLPNQEKAKSIDWDTQKDFEFEYEIGMVEDFSYDLSKSSKVKAYKLEVTDKVVQETLEDLKKRFGKINHPEISESGDTLIGSLRQLTDDPGQTGISNEYAVIPTEKIEKKEQKRFVGLKEGDEVEFDIEKAITEPALKEQILGLSSEKEAAGVKGKFAFKVTMINRTEPAEINQELFDRVFGKDAVKSEAEFIEKIKETVSENYRRESEHFLDHLIEDHFVNNTKINIPQEFLKTWLKTSSNGEVTDAVLEKEFDAYVRGLKWDLIKNKIADDHQIKVEPEEVQEKAKALILSQFGGQAFAEQFKDKLDSFVNNYLMNDNGQNFVRIHNQLKNEKVLNLIKERITLQEKTVSVDEFKKIVEEHRH